MEDYCKSMQLRTEWVEENMALQQEYKERTKKALKET